MKRRNHFHLYRRLLWILLFIIWTAAVRSVDCQPIGPENSTVGFSALNSSFHKLTGLHMGLYLLTDWLSLIPVFVMMFFAGIGLRQWFGRKHILKVDPDILLLGLFFLTVFAAYLLFEVHPVNYRPVLINGFLETSYPSSTTLLVLTVMSASIQQIRRRIKRLPLRKLLIISATAFSAIMVLLRTISGVHWLTDIIGGILLSAALMDLYALSLSILTESNKH